MNRNFFFTISSDLDFEGMVVEIECEVDYFLFLILQERGINNLEFWIYYSEQSIIPACFEINSLIQALNKGKMKAYNIKNPHETYPSMDLYPKIEVLGASQVDTPELSLILPEGKFCNAFKNEFGDIILEFLVPTSFDKYWKMSLDDFYEALSKVQKHFQI